MTTPLLTKYTEIIKVKLKLYNEGSCLNKGKSEMF